MRLNHIDCSIELVGSGIKLQEHNTAYSDGAVEGYIVVPDRPGGFRIRVKTDGFIAAGIGSYVFLDGKYQCNRVVPNLGDPQKYTRVNSVLTGKEVALRDKGTTDFLKTPWRFEDLDVATADAQSEDEDLNGTIIVRIRRALANEPEYTPSKDKSTKLITYPMPPPKAPSIEEFASVSHKSAKASTKGSNVGSAGGLGGLFDGANDAKDVDTDSDLGYDEFAFALDGPSDSRSHRRRESGSRQPPSDSNDLQYNTGQSGYYTAYNTAYRTTPPPPAPSPPVSYGYAAPPYPSYPHGYYGYHGPQYHSPYRQPPPPMPVPNYVPVPMYVPQLYIGPQPAAPAMWGATPPQDDGDKDKRSPSHDDKSDSDETIKELKVSKRKSRKDIKETGRKASDKKESKHEPSSSSKKKEKEDETKDEEGTIWTDDKIKAWSVAASQKSRRSRRSGTITQNDQDRKASKSTQTSGKSKNTMPGAWESKPGTEDYKSNKDAEADKGDDDAKKDDDKNDAWGEAGNDEGNGADAWNTNDDVDKDNKGESGDDAWNVNNDESANKNDTSGGDDAWGANNDNFGGNDDWGDNKDVIAAKDDNGGNDTWGNQDEKKDDEKKEENGDANKEAGDDSWGDAGQNDTSNNDNAGDSGWGNNDDNKDSNDNAGDAWGAANDENGDTGDAWGGNENQEDNADANNNQDTSGNDNNDWGGGDNKEDAWGPNADDKASVKTGKTVRSVSNKSHKSKTSQHSRKASDAKPETVVSRAASSKKGETNALYWKSRYDTHDDAKGKAAARAKEKARPYQHATVKPNYIDSEENPYAIFIFKYRSKAAVEKIVGHEIEDDIEVMRKSVQNMTEAEMDALSKTQLIELLKIKGNDTPPSNPNAIEAKQDAEQNKVEDSNHQDNLQNDTESAQQQNDNTGWDDKQRIDDSANAGWSNDDQNENNNNTNKDGATWGEKIIDTGGTGWDGNDSKEVSRHGSKASSRHSRKLSIHETAAPYDPANKESDDERFYTPKPYPKRLDYRKVVKNILVNGALPLASALLSEYQSSRKQKPLKHSRRRPRYNTPSPAPSESHSNLASNIALTDLTVLEADEGTINIHGLRYKPHPNNVDFVPVLKSEGTHRIRLIHERWYWRLKRTQEYHPMCKHRNHNRCRDYNGDEHKTFGKYMANLMVGMGKVLEVFEEHVEVESVMDADAQSFVDVRDENGLPMPMPARSEVSALAVKKMRQASLPANWQEAFSDDDKYHGRRRGRSGTVKAVIGSRPISKGNRKPSTGMDEDRNKYFAIKRLGSGGTISEDEVECDEINDKALVMYNKVPESDGKPAEADNATPSTHEDPPEKEAKLHIPGEFPSSPSSGESTPSNGEHIPDQTAGDADDGLGQELDSGNGDEWGTKEGAAEGEDAQATVDSWGTSKEDAWGGGETAGGNEGAGDDWSDWDAKDEGDGGDNGGETWDAKDEGDGGDNGGETWDANNGGDAKDER